MRGERVKRIGKAVCYKDKFSIEKVPVDLDTIVIGSGIGGLASAALLSKAGHKVLVLEQHEKAGGCTHTFTYQKCKFDTGIHYVGSNYNRKTLMGLLCEEPINFAPMGDGKNMIYD